MRPSLSAALSLSFLLLSTPVTALAQTEMGPAPRPGTGRGQHIGAPGVPPPPTAQSIAFGKHKIMLGMPQDEVLKLVGESYRVEPEKKDVWWVNENSGGTIGRLYFRDQKLDQVYRDWEIMEPEAGPAFDTMRTALAAFAQMIPGDPRDCKVTSYPAPAEMIAVVVECGKMLVQLHIDSSPGEPDRVFIYTNLGSHTDGPGKRDGAAEKPSALPVEKQN